MSVPARSLAALGLTLGSLVHAEDAAANALVQAVREAVAKQRLDVKGTLRKEGAKDVPIAIYLRGTDFQYRIADERFHLRLAPNSAELFSISGEGALTRFPDGKASTAIAGTDITYQDFALVCLYWPGAILRGEDEINGEACHRLELRNPKKDEAYQSAFMWIHKKYGVFWRIKGFDAKGNPTKQSEVLSIMKMDGEQYTVKTMKVSSLDNSNRTTGITYLEFDAPRASGPKGR